MERMESNPFEPPKKRARIAVLSPTTPTPVGERLTPRPLTQGFTAEQWKYLESTLYTYLVHFGMLIYNITIICLNL